MFLQRRQEETGHGLALRQNALQVENDWKQKLSIEGRNPEQLKD